ncbi:hypothetical protein BGZ50_001330 [Haplosporangium sp. Z 11]|nr:hypothetical protein BGZ50_001330 [Haplosporangium sp. Z 11]
MKQKNNQRSTQLPPAIAAKVLTPAQQREAEADAYIQRAIELHESNDLEQATYYFRLAAQSENPVGQLMYGLSLRHGWGCKPNPKESIFYLQRAAEYAMSELKELSPGNRENIQAIQRHAPRYQQKQGESSQPLKRMDSVQRKSATLTARKELVLALYELGMSFLKGWGVSKDKVIAFNYFKLAADLGDPDSQNETALCFLEGTGTEKNPFEAARYYRLASAQGASQMGNSWIWKPKYDQYCEQQAAAAAATSTVRKMEQQEAGARAGAGLVTPTSPNTPSSAIAAGMASMTACAMVTSSPIGPSPLASPAPGRQQRMSLVQNQPPTEGPARQGRYTLAGDLISSSQLELKIKQAEQLTQLTVKPLFEGSGKGQGQELAAFHGLEGDDLILQAMQLILRKQLHALIHDLGFPSEVEQIAHEYWTLYMSLLKKYDDLVIQNPSWSHQTDKDNRPNTSEDIERSDATSGGNGVKESGIPIEKRLDSNEFKDKASTVNEPPDTIDRMNEYQGNDSESSSSDDDDDDKSEHEDVDGNEDESGLTETEGAGKRKRPSRIRDLSLKHTIAICYLSSLHLKLPVILADFLRWITQEKIPYIRAHDHLPAPMKRRLGNELRGALSPDVRGIEAINRGTVQLLKLYKSSYGLRPVMPSIPPLVLRFVQELMLPIEIYTCAMKFCNVLFNILGAHDGSGSKQVAIKLSYNNPMDRAACCMAVVVMVTKMLFGLDNKDRLESDPQSWISALPSESSWMQSLDVFDSLQQQTQIPSLIGEFEDLIQVNPDLYSEYTKRVLQRPAPIEFYNQLLGIFEASDYAQDRTAQDSGPKGVSLESFIKRLHSGVQPVDRYMDDDEIDGLRPPPLNPGESYVHYTKDVNGVFLGPKVRFKRFEGKEVKCEYLYPGQNIVGVGYIENRYLMIDCSNDGVSFVTDITTKEINSEWGPSTIGGVKMRPGYYYEFTTNRKEAASSQPKPRLFITASIISTPEMNVEANVVGNERHTPQLDDEPTQLIRHSSRQYIEDRSPPQNTLSIQTKTQSLDYIADIYDVGTDSEPAATLMIDPESPPGPYSSNPMPVPFPDRLPAGYQAHRRHGCTMKGPTSRVRGSPEDNPHETEDDYDPNAPTQIIDTPLFLERSMSPEIPLGTTHPADAEATAARSREDSVELSSQVVSQVYSVTASTQQILHQHGHVPSTPLELLNDDRDNMSVQSQDEEQQVPVKAAAAQYVEAKQATTRVEEQTAEEHTEIEQTATEHTRIEQTVTEQTEERQAVSEYMEERKVVIERMEARQVTVDREVAEQMAGGRIEATQSSENKQHAAMSDVSTLEHDLPPSPLPESTEGSLRSQDNTHQVENKDGATLNEPQRDDDAITNKVGPAAQGHEFEPPSEQENAQSANITPSTATPRQALTRQSSRTSSRAKGGSSKHGMESDSGFEGSSKPTKLIKTESVDESLSLGMRGRQTSVPRMYSTRSDLDQGKLGVLISAPGLTREEKNNLIQMLKDFRAEHKENDYKDAAVLVFAGSSRTWKLMCAIVLGLPIVTLDWLKQSSAQGKRLPFSDYVFYDQAMEENYNFKLADSCQLAQMNRDRNIKLFKDYTFYFVTETSKTQKKSQDLINKGFITSAMVTETLTPMVEVCGGKIMRTKPKDSDKGNKTIVIGPDTPCAKTLELVEKGFHVMKREFILSTILKQHLDFSKQHMICLETSTDDEDDNADADAEDEDEEEDDEEEDNDDTNDKAYEDEGTESETTASTKASTRRKTPSKASRGRSVRAASVAGNRRSRKESVGSVTQAATSSSSAPKSGPAKGRAKGTGSTKGRSTKGKAVRKKS